MARALATMALLWPLAQAASVAAAVHGSDGVLTAVVRLVGSRVCHRRPERSFHTAGVQWPVCARCSGVYLGAAVGAWFGFASRFRRRVEGPRLSVWLLLAAVPTCGSWMAEWMFGLPVSNTARAVSALPLGVVTAAIIVAIASPAAKRNRVN